MSETVPTLAVCITCRAGTVPVEGVPVPVPVPGRSLHDRVAALAPALPDGGVRVVGVECLAVCNSGCAASISMPGKWSYLMGRLTPDKAEDLLSFVSAYARSRTGTVMPSRRAASLADMVLGRIPGVGQGTARGEAA